MIKNILILSELSDYFKSKKKHFSFTKGFGIAMGLSKLCKTYYLTLGETKVDQNIFFKNINEINDDFVEQIDFILFIREFNVIDILDRIPSIKKLIKNKKNKIIGMKSDSLGWIRHKMYNKFENKFDVKWHEFIDKFFNFICVQTEDFKINDLKLFRNNKFYNILKDKIFISRMGVFNDKIDTNNLIDPYDINHNYCVDNFTKISENKALKPLCFTGINSKYSKYKLELFNKEKIKLIYMGRIRTDGGKILYILRDMMLKLGDDFELHIFPGRFNIPESNVSVYSSKYPVNLQILRDTIFFKNNNVIIHCPFDDIDKDKYLNFVDIAIDFSSRRPQEIKCNAGNAKLLEYCYYGLKVITEKYVNNSDLVINGKNGIVLDRLGDVDDYVNGVKDLVKLKYDKEFTINQTIKTNGWDFVGKEMYDYILNLYYK